MKTLKLFMIGFGNVGRAFAELLLTKQKELADEFQIQMRITGIATGSHGRALDQDGIDIPAAVRLAQQGQDLAALSKSPAPLALEDFIADSQAGLMLENSPVNYQTGQPAVDHVRAALTAGLHVVSANKGPVVHAYHQLNQLVRDNGCRYMFESAVMDGAPIFSVFREALPAATIIAFKGILNSCTNLLIEKMESGFTFDDAVAYAQSIGITETDPSGDIDGWDAAIKVAALATVLMGQPIKPVDVDRTGIRDLSAENIQSALNQGNRWKLVCSAGMRDGKFHAKVAPEVISPSSPLYAVSGTSSFIEFETDVLPKLGILEGNPSPQTTAYGILADILNIIKQDAV